MQISWPPPGVGWVIAILVLLLLVILTILGQLTLQILAWCVIALAIARLL
jgi:hypothetical protein